MQTWKPSCSLKSELLLVHSMLCKAPQLAEHPAHLGVLSQSEVMFFSPLSQNSHSKSFCNVISSGVVLQVFIPGSPNSGVLCFPSFDLCQMLLTPCVFYSSADCVSRCLTVMETKQKQIVCFVCFVVTKKMLRGEEGDVRPETDA